VIRIRLTRKLAAFLNGVDLSAFRVGDVRELPNASAAMLIAEGWGEPAPTRSTAVLRKRLALPGERRRRKKI
jgi:hypothetical protein